MSIVYLQLVQTFLDHCMHEACTVTYLATYGYFILRWTYIIRWHDFTVQYTEALYISM